MNRKFISNEIAKKAISKLSNKERSEILLNMWHMIDQQDIDEGYDVNLAEFDFSIIKYFIHHEFDENMIYGKFFNPALLYALKFRYLIYNNSKLQQIYKDFYHQNIDINEDSRNSFLKCPCCDFYSLSTKSEYEICGICFWEDDGQTPHKYSSVNRMTMIKYRKNFYEKNSKDELEKIYISDKSI